jgi:hypothetical protein
LRPITAGFACGSHVSIGRFAVFVHVVVFVVQTPTA